MRSPRSVALFLALLILVQAYALARQFALGFRPFGQAPRRVALSWDMFAVSIERCRLTWTPPIAAPEGRLSSQRDLSPLLEWDVVSDAAAAYQYRGHMGCAYALDRTRVETQCFFPDGRQENRAFDCP